MQFQRAPLPAEVEYVLDCALECWEINAFDHAVLTLLGDRKITDGILDHQNRDGRGLRARQGLCLRLDAYAHQLVADLTTTEQASFAAFGMLPEPLKLFGLAQFLATTNHEDQTVGGAMLPYRRYPRCDRNYDPTPRARRRLYSPNAIRRHAKLEEQAIPLARLLAAGLRRLPPSAPRDADLVLDLLREQRDSHRQAHAAARAKFEAEQRLRFGARTSGVDRRVRKAVRRAALFTAGLIGASQVGAFAQGQAITLPGRSLSLEVARNRSVASTGHGALDVRLCTPDGIRLANICVYFDKTPALDQVAALALHLNAGEEAAILDAGNLFSVTPAGAEHPLVIARQAKPATAEDQALVNRMTRHGLGQTDQDRKRAAQQRYEADTIGIYFDAVRTQVWGRDAYRLEPFSNSIVERTRGIEAARSAA